MRETKVYVDAQWCQSHRSMFNSATIKSRGLESHGKASGGALTWHLTDG